MKKYIIANNGSLYFDENENIEVFTILINTKGTISPLISPLSSKIPYGFRIAAIHVVGKNTAATPNITLQQGPYQHDEGYVEYESNMIKSGFNFSGMTDINWLVHSNDLGEVIPQDHRLLGYGFNFCFSVASASNFTGVLALNVYAVGVR